ncbi:hypothetical protein PFICI_02025 [Pestalotiopsis fici W106-1]|uniref:Calcineurin-like phosphoesterase domain-containing protein n=1 Tax=Pestalotiopsis fici (strain W106-1 / CGMCC3.15140) TaxID=1229662 RepID=W3XRR7_PESFW|nr:uncharacterized protein PFICI_02025 [Pestalotiopsis fici W106-1]ETS88197.1 hypothetical protein PFICI_02025 [Pestalotiopsis fici W106-1]
MATSTVKTSVLILSDTHGEEFDVPPQYADVAIHCGDLTEESKIAEFRTTLDLLRRLDAPLKLVVAGNHDFTLDTPTFMERLSEAPEHLDDDLVKREFGDFGEARKLIDDAKDAGIVFLDEGNYQFTLANGSRLRVYATPVTPGKGGWGFKYDPESGHDFVISEGTDIVISHGPPLGVLDYTDSRTRAGCPHLFGAVARTRPRLHCFGHIHEGWGAKLVTWRDRLNDAPSHFTDVDNNRSTVIDKLANMIPNKFDTEESAAEKKAKARSHVQRGCATTSHCSGDAEPLRPGEQTLFVNASSQGNHPQLPHQPFWMVNIELPTSID